MKTRLFLLTVCLLGLSWPAYAADWPQWRGPNRDDVSTETGLLQKWPAGGPRVLWPASDPGIGSWGPAVVGNRLYTMGADETKEFICALDTETGKQVWQTEFAPRF